MHGDPVQGVDPTGQFFAVAGLAVGFAIGRATQSNYNAALIGASVGLLADLSYLTWRMNLGNSLELNWGTQSGRLNHSYHSMTLAFPTGTDMTAKVDEIYDDLKTFKHFNGGHNEVARVRRMNQDGKTYAMFESIGFFGLLSYAINPGEVPVRLWSDVSTRMVVADTAGGHMLVGQRRWWVEQTGATTIEIRTESYDYPRDQLNRFGMWQMGADFQLAVWTQYFGNMRDAYVSQDGATAQTDVFAIHRNPSGDSPWSPRMPYPGMDSP